MELKRKSAYDIQAPEAVLHEAFRSAMDEAIKQRTDIALKILFPDEYKETRKENGGEVLA